MSKIDLSSIALDQDEVEVDGVVYMLTALPATEGLKFLEQYQEQLDTGKADLSVMKHLVCKSVTKDNKVITDKTFDVMFARKLGHLRNLFQEILQYNFSDIFGTSDGDEE